MISISGTLAAAAVAESRSPLCKVSYGSVGITMTALVSGTTPYPLKKVDAGSGYYIVTAYDYDNKVIYYKRLTNLETAANWTSGYSSISTVANSDAAMCHDMMVLSSEGRALVVYEKSNGVVYGRQSDNGGTTWNSEYQIASTGYSRAKWVSLADFTTLFVIVNSANTVGGTVLKYTRPSTTSTTWSADGDWGYDEYYMNSDLRLQEIAGGWEFRTIDTDFYAGIGGANRGWGTDRIQQPFYTQERDGIWSVPFHAFGFYNKVASIGLPETHLSIFGLSREFNNFYYTVLNERYIESVDRYGLSYTDYTFKWHLCKTKDLKSFQMVPMETVGSYETAYLCGIVETETTNNVCMPITYDEDTSYVYLIPTNYFFGYDIDYTEISQDATDNVSLQFDSGSAAKGTVTLNNSVTDYESVLDPLLVMKVESGYNTTSGAEYQDRFVGQITEIDRAVADTDTMNIKMLDFLVSATSVKQDRTHLLFGQNAFHADFSDPLDMEMFVQANGEWVYDAGNECVKNSQWGFYTLVAGYDPDDDVVVSAKFKIGTSVSDFLRYGIIFSHRSDSESGITKYAAMMDDGPSGDFIVWGEDFHRGNLTGKVVKKSTSNYPMALDTNYWLMAKYKGHDATILYSSDGTNWNEVTLSNVDPPWSARYKSYVGLYACVQSALSKVYFDDFNVFSMNPPLSGSDVMKYLAMVSKLDINEDYQIYDEFTGSSFTSRWDSGSKIGTWSVGSGYAQGYYASGNAMIRTDFSASDVIVNGKVVLESLDAGVFARANSALTQCYALTVSNNYVYLKKKDTSWSTLMRVPIHSVTTARLKLSIRGHYISGFVDDELMVYAYDEDLLSGYCGLYGNATGAVTPSKIDEFVIEGFYIPVDVVSIAPGDTAGSVMAQVASMYNNSYFFCDKDGKLRWGTKAESSDVDLDLREVILSIDKTKTYTDIFTHVRVVGDDCFADIRDEEWGFALTGHRYVGIDGKDISNKILAELAGVVALGESQRVGINSVTIPGNPALEIGDIVRIATDKDDAGITCIVKSIGENLGSTYEMSLGELRSDTRETP